MSDSEAVVALTAISSGAQVDVSAAITGFEDAMLEHARTMGLPQSGVLVGLNQRVQVLNNMAFIIEPLPSAHRAGAVYLSKFMLAVSAGLFDAALNYLWDETITELRKRIVAYDLDYFFDLAVSAPEKRKDLKGPDDLNKITDDELIRSSAKIGFISPVGQQQIDLVRFMRNHASAAHPNQHEIAPFQLLAFMETCIREIILLPQSPTMVATSRLLHNVKRTTVSREEASQFAPLFSGLRNDQVEVLANGLFGIYVDLDSTPVIRDNVRLLLPHLWPTISDNVRFAFGVRHARFKANLDQDQAELAREFLEVVGGAAYLPDDVRVGEIDALLDELVRAHAGMDNFYNEPPIAARLEGYLGDLPVPGGVAGKFVETVIKVFMGRSSGISWSADAIYDRMIGKFTPQQASAALVAITGPEFAGLLSYPKPQGQLERLISALGPKHVDRRAKEIDQALRSFSGPKRSLFLDTKIQSLREAMISTQ